MNGWQPSTLRWRRPAGTISGTAPTPPMSPAVCARSAESISGSAWRGIAKTPIQLTTDSPLANLARCDSSSHRHLGSIGRSIWEVSGCALAPFWVEPVRCSALRQGTSRELLQAESRKEHMIKRLIAGAASLVLALGLGARGRRSRSKPSTGPDGRTLRRRRRLALSIANPAR